MADGEGVIELDPRDGGTEERIIILKKELSNTDYKCLKWAEGLITDEDYAPVKEYRQELRDKINELEGSL